METTLAIIKPDGIEHAVSILGRIGNAGLVIDQMKTAQLEMDDVEALYTEHVGKPHFKPHAEHMMSKPVVIMTLQGENAIQKWRSMLGGTDPQKCEKGTIRGDFGTALPCNVAHGSDSHKSAQREIQLFFPE